MHDERVLLSINGYQTDDAYRWAFAIVDGAGARTWEVPRVVTEGVAWVENRVYGFAGTDIAESSSTLTELGPDPSLATFGPTVPNDALWGVTGWDNNVVALTANEKGAAQLLILSPSTQAVRSVRLSGLSQTAVRSWATGSRGPDGLVTIGGLLYWISDDHLWEVDPVDGIVSELRPLTTTARWLLDATGLYSLHFTDLPDGRRSWSVSHFDPTTGETVATLENLIMNGPRDLWLQNVTRVG
ncbi:hypothetical protein [Tessaracoccus sp. MC1756]|uniref:hypothetical protein n=1 Tax=Tessaracoccus sp. MC1756 TaxID=2760311 RepID=UPI0016024367|nr:hypothetical protein [Tessaracoccus sp. MC1756]MBB1510717.1 hypothetical protein [Tessaracoccus sp. MC1756]